MYESFFKLRAKPFQLNPDPAFYYGSRGHRRAMAYLEYGLHQNEGFIVVTGEVGAGKTTIVRSLLEGLDASKVVAAHLVSTQVEPGDLLRMVAAAFGLPTRNLDKAEQLLALETFLVKTTAAGKRALLVVDEAQNLSQAAVEELRMLSNFQLEDHALLQSFLVGQPEFRDIMQGEAMQQLRQRVIATYHLGPLDADETRAYIEHRLHHVGWEGDPAFTPGAFGDIFAFTGGIPRKINTLCDRLLLGAFLADRHEIDEAAVAEVVEELKQEFASPRTGGSANGGGQKIRRLGALAEFDDLPALEVPPELAAQVAALAQNFDVQRIEARIARLEHSLSAALEILNQVLNASRRERSPGEKTS